MSVAMAMATACGVGAPPAAETVREPAAPALELGVLGTRRGAVVLALENRGHRAMSVPGARARVEVRRDGEPVPECSAAGRELAPVDVEPGPLHPGDVRRMTAPLPCTLHMPGEYALLVELVLGRSEGAPSPTDDQLATSALVRVEPAPAE